MRGPETATVVPMAANWSRAAARAGSSVSIVGITSRIWCVRHASIIVGINAGSVHRGTRNRVSASV